MAFVPPGTTEDVTAQQLTDRLGIEMITVTADEVRARMPVAGNLQPYGLLHGGASAALAETLGSIAAALHAAPDRVAVGLELSCTHHRAARSGHVEGVCVPLHRGRSTATHEIVITDGDGRRVCTARLTCVLLDTPPGR